MTLGFPADLTADVVREREIGIDEEGFRPRWRSNAPAREEASSFGVNYNDVLKLDFETPSLPVTKLSQNTQVVGIYRDGVEVNGLIAGEEGRDRAGETPLCESGGQVGDSGILKVDDASSPSPTPRKPRRSSTRVGWNWVPWRRAPRSRPWSMATVVSRHRP